MTLTEYKRLHNIPTSQTISSPSIDHPMRCPPVGLAESTEKNILKGIEQFSRPVSIHNEKIRMLLIDDNLEDVVKLQQIIRKMDCCEIDVDWVSTIKSAVENIDHNTYDVCMMDVAMADEIGSDLTGVISKNRATTPLVLLKNNTDIGPADNESADCIDKASLNPELLKHCIRYTIERSRRVKKLKDAQKYLRLLSSKLIDAQERERKLIGRELHDSIGSSLTAIRMALDIRKKGAGKNDPKKTGKGKNRNTKITGNVPLEAILSMIDETIEETRRISEKLRPSILDDLGLVKTIGWMQRKFQVLIPGITIGTYIGVTESQIPEPLKIVIYRILQEALNNIAKHSNADRADIALKITDGRLELSIRDNGDGFDPKNPPSPTSGSGRYGLEGMQDRAEFTKGDFTITSGKKDGTIIRIRWPINPEHTV